MCAVARYLTNCVNKSEDITELLKTIIKHTESNTGVIFIKNNNSYESIACVSETESSILFQTTSPIINILINDLSNITADYTIKTSIILPIIQNSVVLGILCLFDREEGYNDDIIPILNPYISLIQLILSKKQLELNTKVQSEKDLFLANMSHEIRTPLNGVIGYNQLLLQTELDKVQKQYLEYMNQCSIQLMQIINDILDFSKLSAGKMDINKECVKIKDIIDAITYPMTMRIKEKYQKCKVNMDSNIPDYIILDKQKLIQIVMNLVTNANKFTGKHGTIEINFVHKEDLLLEISVRDDGIGISSENIKRIFSAFEQIENSHSKNGTGLGLAICTKLCNLMGATMNVDSNLGKGSTFTITVPYEVSENINKLDYKDCTILEGKTVLVVDDNSNNRLFLSETLFEWNMQPIICASPLEALRMILGNRYNFDLGLIDICMPNISGNELAEQIKSERPLFPMIALSSNDSFISNNFRQKIDKPINKLQLFNAVYNVLNTKYNPQTYLGCCSKLQEESSIITCDKFNKKLNILIAEDIPYNKTLLVTMLENMKYTNINTAENGQIAVEMIRESYEKGNPYHILLLDLRMPVMDGYQVLDIYHKNNWKLPNIIVVTASIMDKDREKCKMLGAKYFINKPIDIKELETTMLHACELTENLLYI